MRLQTWLMPAALALLAGSLSGCGGVRQAPDAKSVGQAGKYINPSGQGMGMSGNPLPASQGGSRGAPGIGGGGAGQGMGGVMPGSGGSGIPGLAGRGGPPAGVPGLGR